MLITPLKLQLVTMESATDSDCLPDDFLLPSSTSMGARIHIYSKGLPGTSVKSRSLCMCYGDDDEEYNQLADSCDPASIGRTFFSLLDTLLEEAC